MREVEQYPCRSCQHAHDLPAWEANQTRVQEEIATSTQALEKARQLEVDADTLTALQARITTLGQKAAEVKPPKRSALALCVL